MSEKMYKACLQVTGVRTNRKPEAKRLLARWAAIQARGGVPFDTVLATIGYSARPFRKILEDQNVQYGLLKKISRIKRSAPPDRRGKNRFNNDPRKGGRLGRYVISSALLPPLKNVDRHNLGKLARRVMESAILEGDDGWWQSDGPRLWADIFGMEPEQARKYVMERMG